MTTQAMCAVTSPLPPESKLLGETYGFWCQTVALIAAAVLAYLALRNSRAIERRKAAAEAIFAGRRDKELREAVRHIAVLHLGDKNMAVWGKEENKDSEEAKIIRYALNHYEYVSVAISQGIYDEIIFKNAMYTSLTKVYDRTKPFIDSIRQRRGENTAWQEFECLACRWKQKPLKTKTIKSVEDTNYGERSSVADTHSKRIGPDEVNMSTVACETTVKVSTDPSIFILGTRSVAVPLRQQVESALQNERGNICLDFAGVTVTQGYMDELLGVLILRYGPSLLDRVAFKTCSDDVQAVIRFVATARIRDYKALAEKTVLT